MRPADRFPIHHAVGRPMCFPMSDSTRYARIRYRLMLANLVGSLAWLAVCQLSGWSAAWARWVERALANDAARVAGYMAIFGACSLAVFLPMKFYGSFVVERRFGLSRQSVRGWIVREAKHVAIGGLLSLAMIEGLYGILRRWPAHWVALATIGWVAVSAVLARVFPTLVLPMFYKTAPLADRALTSRLLALCDRARLSVLGIFRVQLGVETRKANAALAGLGATRRVLVSDTLLEHFTPDEVETVLAHELGHQRFRHIGKFLVISAVGSWMAFQLIALTSSRWMQALGLRDLADLAGFPMLMMALSILGLVGLPLQNAISRHFEWQADHFAVSLTRLPQSFASALRKLGDLNLADPNPPRWIEWLFYDHPPIAKRIAVAEAAK